MRLSKLYRSMLIYLLFCYGSKYAVSADAPKNGASSKNPSKTGGTPSRPSGGRSQTSMPTPTPGQSTSAMSTGQSSSTLSQSQSGTDQSQGVSVPSKSGSKSQNPVTQHIARTLTAEIPGPNTQSASQPGTSSHLATIPKTHNPFIILTQDNNDSSKCKENDNSKYDIEEHDYGNEWKLKSGSKCVGLKFDDIQIWNYSDHIDKGYPKSICFRSDIHVFILEFNDWFYFYRFIDNVYDFIDLTKFNEFFSNLKIITTSDSGNLTNDTKSYDFKKYGFLFEYKFKSGSKCVEVKYKDSTAWQHDPNIHGNSYPKSVYVDAISPIMVKVVIDNDSYVYIYLSDQWKSFQDLLAEQSKNLIELDLNKKESTDQVEYSNDAENNVETYTAKDQYLFKKVTRGSNTICEAQNNKYPNKVTVTKKADGKSSVTLGYPQPVSTPKRLTPTTPTDVLSTLTLVELDITKTENTNQYEHSDGIYTAKAGYAFSKVYKNTHLLKEFHHTYPNKVQIDSTDTGYILLTVVYEDNSTFLFVKDPDESMPHSNGKSTSVTSTSFVLQGHEVYADHLKHVTNEDRGSSIVDTNKFSIETIGGLLNYTFKKGSKCTELNYDNQNLWKHDLGKHGNNYPTNVLFNTATKFIMVDCTGVYQYFYSYYNNQWNQISGFESKAIEKLDLNKLKFVTLDSDGKIKENDQTKFDKKEEGSIISYKFKEGSKCLEVKFGPHLVWDYVESQHKNKYPTKVTLNTDTLSLTVDSSGNYRHFYSYFEDKFKQTFAYKIGTEKLYPIRLKLITQEIVGTLKENDQSKFDREERGPVYEYKFKEGSKCVELKYDETTVWKYDGSIHGPNYPTSLTLNTLRNVVMVKSSDQYTQMYTYYDEKWSVGPSHGLKPQFKLDELKLVTLEPDGKHKENDGSNFEKLGDELLVSCRFEDGSKCVQIKYGAYTVWKYDGFEHGKKYPTKISININTLSLTVDSSGNYCYFYSYFDNKFKQVSCYKYDSPKLDPSRLKVITEYLGQTKENDPLLLYRKDQGSVVNYTLKVDSKCVEVKYDQTTVWKYDNSVHGNKYPTTVIVNIDNNLLTVDSSGNYRQFYSYYNYKWNVGPSYGLKSHFKFDKLDVETLESDDTRKLNDDAKFDKQEQGSIVSYTFKPGARCTAIRYDNDLVWEHDEHIYGYTYPTGLTMNVSTSFILLESRGQYQNFYSYYNGAWRPIVSHRTHDVTGSLDYRSLKFLTMSDHDTIVEMHESEYYVRESGQVFTYEFTDVAHCFRIQYGSILVWEYNPYMHKDHYPTSLAFNIQDRNIVIESEHEYTHFFSFGGDQSKQTSYDTIDPDKLKLITEVANVKKENDRTKFDKKEAGPTHEYKFKAGSKCVEVKYDQTTVWKYDNSIHGTNYPTSVTLDIAKNLLTVDSSDHYKRFYSYSRGSFYNASKSDSNKLKVITKDDDGSEKENDDTKYSLKTGENEDNKKVDVYEFHEGSKCVRIDYEEKTVWEHDSDKYGDQYPKIVEYNSETKKALIHINQVSFQYRQTVATLVKFEVSVETGIPRNVRHIKPAEVNIRSEDSSDLLDCVIDEKSKTRTYTAKSSYAFEKVFQKKGSCNCCGSDNVVYEPSEKIDYSIQVVVFNTGKSDKQARMYLVPGTTKYFYKEKDGSCRSSKPWNETERGEKGTDGNELITIDVDKDKVSNNLYEYKVDNKKQVYTMKDGFGVKRVHKGETKLWECTDESYGLKVVIKPLVDIDKDKIGITVDRKGGYSTFGVFDPKAGTVAANQLDRSKVKLFTKGEKEELVELIKETHYEVKPEEDGSTKYALSKDSKCVTVKYGSETVWEQNSSHEGQYPTNVYFLANGMLKVAVNRTFDEKVIRRMLMLSYKDEDDLSRNLIKLEVDKTESTEHIEYSKVNNIETYTAKGKFLIKTVKRGNRVIWRSYNGTYPNKLTVTQGADGKYKMQLSYGDVVLPPPMQPTQTSQQKTVTTSGTSKTTGTTPTTPSQGSTPSSVASGGSQTASARGAAQGSTPAGQAQTGSAGSKPSQGSTKPRTAASGTPTTPSGGSSQSSAKTTNLSGSSAKSGKPK